jgi:hypothetical protein
MPRFMPALAARFRPGCAALTRAQALMFLMRRSASATTALTAVATSLWYFAVVPRVLAALAFNFGVRWLGPAVGLLFVNMVPVSVLVAHAAKGRTPSAAKRAGAALKGVGLVFNARAGAPGTGLPQRAPRIERAPLVRGAADNGRFGLAPPRRECAPVRGAATAQGPAACEWRERLLATGLRSAWCNSVGSCCGGMGQGAAIRGDFALAARCRDRTFSVVDCT